MAGDETGDATRRTLLASERTVLAWLRTGLTVIAVAVGVGKIAPELDGDAVAWGLAGAAWALLGVAVIVYGFWRGRAIDRAVRSGRFVSLDDGAMWTIGGASVGLGLLTAVLIVIDVA
jgi:putative membrane protein